jgi:hypothetical protein
MDYMQFTGNNSFIVLPKLSVVSTGGTVVCTELQQEDGEEWLKY